MHKLFKNDKSIKEKKKDDFFLGYSKTDIIIREDVENGEGGYLQKTVKGFKDVFITKGLLYFFIFIVIMLFFIWMWYSFFKNNEPDFKKDFEKNFLPTNSVASSSAQTNSATSQTPKTTPQVASASPSQNNQSPQLPDSKLETEEKKEENKKFESKNLGFSLEYPEGVVVAEAGDTVTVTKDSLSWKIKIYDNKNKKDFQAWYTDHFNIKDAVKCSFIEGTVKVGSYESKQVKAANENDKCEGDGNFAINADKSKVVKVELGKETTENVNKILTNFKFND
jgi:hypothetical protein